MPNITYRDLMLATSAKAPFTGQGWLFELKLDGFRCLASKRGNRARLESRTGRDMSACFPEIVECLRSLGPDLVIDGELVVLDGHRRPPFERLKARAAKRKPETCAREPPPILPYCSPSICYRLMVRIQPATNACCNRRAFAGPWSARFVLTTTCTVSRYVLTVARCGERHGGTRSKSLRLTFSQET